MYNSSEFKKEMAEKEPKFYIYEVVLDVMYGSSRLGAFKNKCDAMLLYNGKIKEAKKHPERVKPGDGEGKNFIRDKKPDKWLYPERIETCTIKLWEKTSYEFEEYDVRPYRIILQRTPVY